MLSEEEIRKAKVLAKVIKAEMRFPVQLRPFDKSRLVEELCDVIPSRGNLDFTKVGGGGKPAARDAVGGDYTVEDTFAERERVQKLIFCIAHGDFVLDAGMDLDHVTPFTKIRRKQEKLLKFLNANQEFADIFLAEPGVNELFRRDDDGKVKGTKYFFKLCYNDIDNLVLICHACNIGKGADDSLEWFRQQRDYFGGKFVEKVGKDGGLHEGVILPKIYEPDFGDEMIDIGEEEVIRLHIGESQGLGAFAMEWFSEIHQEEYDILKRFHIDLYGGFKKDLAKVQELIVDKKMGEAREAYSILSKGIISAIAAHKGTVTAAEERRDRGSGSGSGSDSSGDAKRRKQISGAAAGEAYDVNHQIKKLKTYLLELKYAPDDIRKLCDKCSYLHGQKVILKGAWEEIFADLKEYIEESNRIGRKLELAEIDAKIVHLHLDKVYEVDRLRDQTRKTITDVSAAAERESYERRSREKSEQEALKEKLAKEENARLLRISEQSRTELIAEVARLRAEKASSERDEATVLAGDKRSADSEIEMEGIEDEEKDQKDVRRKRRR